MVAYELFLPLACVADIERSHFSVTIVAYVSGLFTLLADYVVLFLWKVVCFVIHDDDWILS